MTEAGSPSGEPSRRAPGPSDLAPPRSRRLDGTRVLAIAPTPFFSDYGCHVRILEEVDSLRRHGVETSIATYAFGRDVPGLDIHRASRLVAPRRLNPGSSLYKYSMD